MGSGVSHALSLHKEGMTEEDVIDLVLPKYYTKDSITEEELTSARHTWDMIINNQSKHFDDLKEQSKNFTHNNCIEYFYYAMFTHLLDIHPDSKDSFTPSPPGQGRSFVHYMKVLLDEIHEHIKWNETLINLTIHHSRMGVKAMEYGVLGDIFMHAVKECVGVTVYNDTVERGWKKIWSKILSIMVPVAVKFELDTKNVVLNEDDDSSFKQTFIPEEKTTLSEKLESEEKELFHGVRRAAMMFGSVNKHENKADHK